MADFAWLVRRLKAMSVPEIAWRVSQKAIQKEEKKKYKLRKMAVTENLFNEKLVDLKLNADRMHLNFDNNVKSLNTSIPLLGGYDYKVYWKRWNAGFQTENEWPEVFSYDLEYKQRDDIGDARTNWELNRHFQFTILAKNYAASGDERFLSELIDLFNDWNSKNPFLWGISWTSVMEVAIRCSNWCYAYSFLQKANAPEELLSRLHNGILNMTDYIANHYSRYSSANNHLIVEAYAIGQVGILCSYQPWISLSVEILTRELPLQNYSDGINKELSLHYQSFYMEAMGLMMRLLIKNKIDVPEAWKSMLDKMCSYVANCMGDYGEVVVFGDDDEGKILDLHGGLNHYSYVLGLFSIMLDKQYTDLDMLECENLNWLFLQEERERAKKYPLYLPPLSVCYREGGNTILRSNDRKILIGIDHAALGFGSIAAHGHADALSFQMFVGGEPVFVDPGTYIYHCDIENRNAFRRTENHNSICVDGKDQSEMLGAFLWGAKSITTILDYRCSLDYTKVVAENNGYENIVIRTFEFCNNTLTITDVSDNSNSVVILNIGPGCDIKEKLGRYYVELESFGVEITLIGACRVSIETTDYSRVYGQKELIKSMKIEMFEKQLITKLEVKEKSNV